MGVVVGVVIVDIRLIFFVEVCLFALVALGVFAQGVQPAAAAFVVDCLCQGGVDVQKSLLPQLQAVVHIVVRHGELFLVQTAHFTVERCFCHQAGTGHRHKILRGDKAVHIAHRIGGVSLVAVSRAAVDAHNDARVLDFVVGENQLGTHGTHVGALAVAEQLPQKVLRGNLDIVIQQQQLFAVGKLCAKVVDGRKIEFPLIAHHAAVGKFLRNFRVITFGFRVCRVIFNDQHLKIVVARILIQARQAAVQIVRVVLVGDHHGNPRMPRQLVVQLKRTRCAGNGAGFALQPDALQVGVDGALPRCDGVGLGVHRLGGGAGSSAPDVQTLFDVMDFCCLFGQAQNQIVILCAVIFRAFVGARRVQQLAAEHRQMGDVVDPAQVIGRKIGLKMVAAQLLEIVREDNLVTVQKIRARLLNRLDHIIQRVGVDHIVVIQQGQIFAGGDLEPFGGVGGNAAVFDFAVDKAGILLRQRRRLGRNFRVGGITGVHHHQLPVGVGLLAHAAGHLLKIARRCVKKRHHNTDAGSLQVFGALGAQFFF